MFNAGSGAEIQTGLKCRSLHKYDKLQLAKMNYLPEIIIIIHDKTRRTFNTNHYR